MIRALTGVFLRLVFNYRYCITCIILVLVFTVAVRLLLSSSTIHKESRLTSINKQDRSPNNKTQCKKQDGQQVILLTYGRSGSSLTTEIIKQQKGVYVYFEPLHNLAKLYEPLQMEHLEVRERYLHLTSIPEYNKKALEIIERLMTCNFQHLPRAASTNLHMRLYDSAGMFWCIKRAGALDEQTKCLSDGENKCKKKPIRFFKIIRLSTQSVGRLMDKHPCLKMIYLVRDPRGSFISKQRAFNFLTSNTTYEAERFCWRVNKDIDHALRLSMTYPDRVYLARYENIAENPIKTSRQLYQFLGFNFTDAVAEYVYNNTLAGFGDRRVYTLARRSSSEVSYAWRTKIKLEDALIFDQQCSKVYSKLGYLPISSEKDLKNLKIPLKFEKDYLN